MPVNRKYDIASVVAAARYYFEKTGRRVIFEYTLIAGVNDTDRCAVRLSELVRGFPAHVNLIRLNPAGSALSRPSADAANAFLAALTALGVSATIRRSFGEDIEGACGQLRRRVMSEEKAAEAGASAGRAGKTRRQGEIHDRMKTESGRVVKAVASRFWVDAGGSVKVCFARKKLKSDGDIYVGDKVVIAKDRDAYVIESLFPARKTCSCAPMWRMWTCVLSCLRPSRSRTFCSRTRSS